GLSVRTGGGDACAHGLQASVSAHVVGVPVGVHHQRDTCAVHPYPRGGLSRVADEAAVDQCGPPPAQQEQVAVGQGPALPCHPGREPFGGGAIHPRSHSSGPFTQINVCWPVATSDRVPSETACTSSRHTVS